MASYIAMFLSIIALLLLGKHSRWGWIVQIAAACVWIIWAISILAWALLIFDAFIIGLSVKGWVQWKSCKT